MKKFLILFIGMVFVTITAYAAPVGNIADPAVLSKGLITEEGEVGFIAGTEIDITFDRKFKNQAADTEFNFYGAKIGATIGDKALVYALLGAGDASQEFSILGTTVKWETETDFIWGVGATAIVYEQEMEGNTLRIGIDGRYRRADLEIDKVVIGGTSYSLSDLDTAVDYELNEWQVALALSYQISNFIPYVGVKYSDVDGEEKATLSGTVYKADVEADDNFGIFVGSSFVINDMASINVEGRFLDEEALTIGANIRF